MRDFLISLRAEHRAHPWMAPGVALTAAAAFGSWAGMVLS